KATEEKSKRQRIPADKKAPIDEALAKLKEAHKAQDIDAIDAASNALNTAFQAASQDMYNAANAQQGGQAGPQDFGGGQPGADSSAGDQGNVTDVDFEEVK
ncbi:MAG TPA: molecular chaperone DnaK, partial [Paludibacter sp.]|nr:molecular chaperone DnaK [Paludibacter sp.]